MKFTVTLKDPDGPYECIREAAYESARLVEGLPLNEAKQLAEQRREWLGEFVRQWIAFGEYVTIEFDTDLQTATVKRAK